MSRFVTVDRQTSYLLPPSMDEWLPANYLACFVVEVIKQLDLSALTRQYGGRGSAAHLQAVLLDLLVYGFASGVHSNCKIERATNDSKAFRFVAANTHPDHECQRRWNIDPPGGQFSVGDNTKRQKARAIPGSGFCFCAAIG